MNKIDTFSEEIKSKSFMECFRLRNEINCRLSAFEAGQGDFYLYGYDRQEVMYYDDLIRLSLLCRHMAERYRENDYNIWR